MHTRMYVYNTVPVPLRLPTRTRTRTCSRTPHTHTHTYMLTRRHTNLHALAKLTH